jgi:hypothetical protein
MLQSDHANQKGGATRLLVCAAQLMIGRLPHLPRWLSAELNPIRTCWQMPRRTIARHPNSKVSVCI